MKTPCTQAAVYNWVNDNSKIAAYITETRISTPWSDTPSWLEVHGVYHSFGYSDLKKKLIFNVWRDWRGNDY